MKYVNQHSAWSHKKLQKRVAFIVSKLHSQSMGGEVCVPRGFKDLRKSRNGIPAWSTDQSSSLLLQVLNLHQESQGGHQAGKAEETSSPIQPALAHLVSG